MTYHKLWLYAVLGCFIILTSSCFGTDAYGYPDHVTLNREGSMVIIVGTENVPSLDIDDEDFLIGPYRDDEFKFVNDTLFYRYKWLTARIPIGQKKVLISATPNDTGKKRKMWIEWDIGPEMHTVFITQLAK